MALSTKLNEVIDMVRDEAKLSSANSRGVDHRAMIVRKIKRYYETLIENYDWAHLNLKKDDANARVQLSNVSVVYAFPSSVNPQKITKAWLKWGSGWEPLAFGIDLGMWGVMDPQVPRKADPITHWDFYSLTQFGVFPMPATNGVVGGQNEVAFEGQRKPTALTAEDSTLDIDDQVIALMVAAEILEGNGQKSAAGVAAGAAKSRLDTLQGNVGSKARTTMGMGFVERSRGLPRHPKYIRG